MQPIDRLLTDLQTALRKADFAEVESISAMLETILIPADPAILRRAARIAGENARLLSAAMGGLRTASRRLSDLRGSRKLTTYDGTGRRVERNGSTAGTKRI